MLPDLLVLPINLPQVVADGNHTFWEHPPSLRAAFSDRQRERDARATGYIRNTPNLVASIGALRQAANASPSTRRVSDGMMMPSSHIRAVA